MTAVVRSTEDRSAGNRTAIISMIVAIALFSLGDMVMKVLTRALPVGETIIVRMAFALPLLFAVMRARGEKLAFGHFGIPVLWLRSACEGALVVMFISTLGHLTLGDLTTITQTTPILMTALAAFFLKETVGWRRWSAACVGFLGVVLVAKPGAGGFNPWVLMGVGVALLVAIRDLVTRFVPANVPTGTVTLMTTLAAGLSALTLVPFETWRGPSWQELVLCAAAAVCTTIGNVFIIRAFRVGEVSVVSPFRYIVIPFALFWGWLGFGERPDGWALCGIALIVGAGVYTLHRERVRARQARETAGR